MLLKTVLGITLADSFSRGGSDRRLTPPRMRFHARARFLRVFLHLLAVGSLAAQTPVLHLACEDKLDFPHVLGDGQEIAATRPGVSIEFIQMLGEELGVRIVIKRLPWKRALELELKDGTIDGLFPISYTKEREVFGVLPMKDAKPDESRRMFESSYFFYKLKASPLAWDGKHLKNLNGPIGAPRGYSIVGDLRQMGYEVQESDDVRKDMKRLSMGWLAVLAGLEPAQDYLLNTNPELGKDIMKVHPALSTKHYYLMLSHSFVEKDPQLAQRIWDKCRELREREMTRLLKRYTGK